MGFRRTSSGFPKNSRRFSLEFLEGSSEVSSVGFSSKVSEEFPMSFQEDSQRFRKVSLEAS